MSSIFAEGHVVQGWVDGEAALAPGLAVARLIDGGTAAASESRRPQPLPSLVRSFLGLRDGADLSDVLGYIEPTKADSLAVRVT